MESVSPTHAPLVTFIVPVRHPANARSWDGLKSRLQETLASISSQSHSDWKCIVVANRGSDLPPLPDKTEICAVDFPPNQIHEITSDNRAIALDSFRLDKGRRVLSGMLMARDTRFFMIVDDDDFISHSLVDYVSNHRNEVGWYIDKGYLWEEGSKWLFKVDDFNKRCGTCLIVRSDIYNLPVSIESASEDWIKQALGSHHGIFEILQEKGMRLNPLPYLGAVYRVGNPGSHSKTKGVLGTYILNRRILRNPMRWMGSLRKLKRLSAGARREFFGAA